VTAPAVRGAKSGPPARVRIGGAALLLALVLMTAFGAPWTPRLQEAWFDAYQALHPRDIERLPVTIVEIDQKSLNALGQWPWPRTRLAQLVDAINALGPTAIGIDILMPEVDALSPEYLLSGLAIADPRLAGLLDALPSNDLALANALRRAPAVLVLAGTLEPSRTPFRSVPIIVAPERGAEAVTPAVKQHAGAISNLDVLDVESTGWGLISVDTEHGVVRRMPMVADIAGTLVPSLALEMLRVATHAPAVRITTRGSAVRTVGVGPLEAVTAPDGSVRPYFSTRRLDRFVSALDLWQGKVDPALIRGQLVLIGPTAIGVDDYQDTPVGERMPGSEIHAQLIENLLAGSLLRRPAWASTAEAALLLLFGAALIWATPRWRPLPAALLMLALVTVPILAGYALFRGPRWLFDTATPGLSLVVMLIVLLVATLAESTRQRRSLERVVQAQREQAARVAGELEAAQRIQTGTLPRLDLLKDDRRIDLHAVLTPAREVGGDLYDFFMLDERHLFFMIGDVAGKGLSASIFMAVGKALYKGAMLRTPQADIGDIMVAANTEVSRDNAQMLFVSVFAGILDLDSGRLQYCNAGHDNPFRLRPGASSLLRIEDGDGPPLCAMADYAYRSASLQLEAGECLCLTTDGVTEAQNTAGELFGVARLQRLLQARPPEGSCARDLVQAIHAEVQAFVGGADPADDLTIVALRWRGPAGAQA
jgi:serine phosphatase RsbU (regulator of sigma subunit)/CHASE2 domain-containing sensor protein